MVFIRFHFVGRMHCFSSGKIFLNVIVSLMFLFELLWIKHIKPLIYRGGAIGGKGGKSPLKISKKEKMKKYQASKLLKLAFLSSLTRKYVLWKGFYHDFSTKKASASQKGFQPQPRGSAPWTPEVPSLPLKIYPGADPAYITILY